LTYPTETPLGTFFTTVLIGSPDCLKWLNSSIGLFSYESQGITITVKREKRQRGGLYWYAYKRVGGKLSSRYIGGSEQVTIDKLNEITDHFRNKIRSEQVTQQNDQKTK
jgi:LuxR family maltose regulon positive regulatory protein